ncbi:non-specific lipid-transfer protein 1-like [Apium graveolens]|uniref:non-specific lipid-transfer protein 1-like n=1 Tax=Apium graveolens TaxID=4045 RepID=UPI003D78C3D4
MGFSKVALAVLGLMLMVVFIDRPAVVEGAINCVNLQNSLKKCVGYLKHGGRSVRGSCCNAVRSLNTKARSTADRRQACRCIKQAVSTFRRIISANVASLPGKCGLRIPYRISPSLDCNK